MILNTHCYWIDTNGLSHGDICGSYNKRKSLRVALKVRIDSDFLKDGFDAGGI
jgi:hypothetical protein